jgi:hypothetical protein
VDGVTVEERSFKYSATLEIAAYLWRGPWRAVMKLTVADAA